MVHPSPVFPRFPTHHHPGGAVGKKKSRYGRRKFVAKNAAGSFAKKLMILK